MRFYILLLTALFMLTACGQTSSEPESESDTTYLEGLSEEERNNLLSGMVNQKPYSLFWQLRVEVNDYAHNAKAAIPYATFYSNDTLTESVNSSLFLPMILRYNEYLEMDDNPVMFMTIDACVYESEEFLSMACMETLTLNAPVVPNVIGVIVDLEGQQTVPYQKLLKMYDRTEEELLTDAAALFAALCPERTELTITGVTTAFLDADGDRIFVLSTNDPTHDIPQGVLFYNDTDRTLATGNTLIDTFADIEYRS